MIKTEILIIDFGGQYKELIARRARELGVYSEILPHTVSPEKIREIGPSGLIFTGGPNSVYDPASPAIDPAVLKMGIPILGICYGMQLLCHMLGGDVRLAARGEYGTLQAKLDTDCPLFKGLRPQSRMLMSHRDQVTVVPEGFRAVASTRLCPVAAVADPAKKLYGVQFHPEVENSEQGIDILKNFIYGICGCEGGYTVEHYLKMQTEAVRKTVGGEKVLLGLSGGVDSSVCAALFAKAIPGQLVCVYIDHGCMRKQETEQIKKAFSGMDLDLVCVDAHERFLNALSGISDPEQKRKIIGREFVSTFEDASGKIGNPTFLAQGTIYPDVVESGTQSAVIKSHHNVGGLPANMRFKGVVEPLRFLFKDEVRKLGRLLGLPDEIVERQPFPGPGLAVRIKGALTAEKLDLLREADAIVREEIGKLKDRPDQYFAVLTDLRSVGVMGDSRTYDYTVAVRAVKTNDFMTCEFAKIPYPVLSRISKRITNEVQGVNRVVYDISGKPPATIEWE